MNKNEAGYATLWTVIVLSALTILAASVMSVPARSAVEFTAFQNRMERDETLDRALVETIEALRADQNYQSDAPGDPIWGIARSGFDGGIEVIPKDLSSAVNPNSFSIDFLNDDELRTKFRYFTAPAEMKRRIASDGFFLTPEEAEDFLPESSTDTFFTFHGLWNPAVSDEISLARLIAERTGQTEATASLATALVSAGSQSSKANRAGYEAILGDAADALRPLVTDEPLINVHFADAELLRIVLGMEFDGKPLPDPGNALGNITAARLEGEITPSSLQNMISIEDGQEAVFEILGTKTWFWEITVKSGTDTLIAVLARIPPAVEGEPPDFQIVSRRITGRAS